MCEKVSDSRRGQGFYAQGRARALTAEGERAEVARLHGRWLAEGRRERDPAVVLLLLLVHVLLDPTSLRARAVAVAAGEGTVVHGADHGGGAPLLRVLGHLVTAPDAVAALTEHLELTNDLCIRHVREERVAGRAPRLVQHLDVVVLPIRHRDDERVLDPRLRPTRETDE